MRSLDFSIDQIQPHYGPGVDSASNRNEYQESSWGKGLPARIADNLTACYRDSFTFFLNIRR
jgi:hypothetical protein